jgi:transposase-like protein
MQMAYLLKNEGKKFCTTCQKHKPEKGGVKGESRFRAWRCKDCHEHRTVSIYKSKGQNINGRTEHNKRKY